MVDIDLVDLVAVVTVGAWLLIFWLWLWLLAEVVQGKLAAVVPMVLILGTVLVALAFPGMLEQVVGSLARLPGADEKFLRIFLVGWGGIVFILLAFWLIGFLITRRILRRRYALQVLREDINSKAMGEKEYQFYKSHLEQFMANFPYSFSPYSKMADDQAALWPLTLPLILGQEVVRILGDTVGGITRRLTLTSVTLALLALLITVLFLARALELVK